MMEEELRVGICDDKEDDIKLIADALYGNLSKIGLPVKVRCQRFLNGEDLYGAAEKEPFHIVFLDIEMPGLDGFGLAERLNRLCPHTYLNFVSVHESFVFSSFRYMLFYFIRKSHLASDMLQALQKYFQVTASTRSCYRIKEGACYRELPIRDILYIEGSGHSLIMRLADGKLIRKSGSLISMEKELAGHHFLRIHKNFLVNQRHVKEIGRREVYLIDEIVLEMGRDRRTKIREAMIQYEKEKEHYGYW